MSEVGTEAECISFSARTDSDLSGCWYHATSEAVANGLSAGTYFFESDSGKLKDKISFTRDPNGAARNLAGWEAHRWVVQAYIKANRTMDKYDTESHGLTNNHNWVHVWDVRCIMVEKNSVRERDETPTNLVKEVKNAE